MGERWFIEREGVAYGPADVSELSQWITEGRLDWSDMLWPENTDRSTAVPAYTALQGLGLIIQAPATGDAAASSAQLLAPQVAEIPNMQLDQDSFEIPLLPDSFDGEPAVKAPAAAPEAQAPAAAARILAAAKAAGAKAPAAAAKAAAAKTASVAPAAGGKSTPPDWLKSLAEALEADRKKPRVSPPDWLEDVQQAEKAALPPRRNVPIPSKDALAQGADPQKDAPAPGAEPQKDATTQAADPPKDAKAQSADPP